MKFAPNGISEDINIITNKKELEKILNLIVKDRKLEDDETEIIRQIENIIKVN
jgi:hypothetical protein